MKKSLFAVAATTAFTGAAQAQSSVTVYGILDVGYTNGSAMSTSPLTGTPTSVVKQNVSRISNSMESGSRLGFRGNEDLGGGTSAQFVFELGIQPAGNGGSNWAGTNSGNQITNVATTSDAGNAGSPNWTPNVRQAFVGLTQKGIGTLRVGTQNTFNWEQAGSNTSGQLNQTLGSMLAPTTDGAYFATNTRTGTLSGTTSGTNTVANGSALAAFTNRTTNTVTFRTERISGAMVKLGAVVSNQDTTQTSASAGGNANQFGWMGGLDWNIQKANIQASYQVFKSEAPANAGLLPAATCSSSTVTTCTVANAQPQANAATNAVVAWGSGVQGNNISDAQALITASYDFGILRAYAGWADRKLTSGSNANQYAKRTAQEIGVRGYATKTIEYWGSIGNGRYQAYGTGNPTANITGWQAGSNYWMSKRTNLYAIYGQNNTSTTTLGSASASQASVGVRHTF
jgi:predicted porin